MKLKPLPRSVTLVLAFLLFVSLAAILVLRADLFARDRVWARVQRTGVWRVGLDPSFPPFEMVDAEGRVVGFDVDLAEAIAARWGVRATFVSIGFDGLIDAVRADRVDAVISAMPYDPLLTRDVRFSKPYFDAGWRVVVPLGSPITRLQELAGRRLAAEWGSEGHVWGRRLRDRHPGLILMLKPTAEEVVTAVLNGEADAALLDGVMARRAATRLRGVDTPLTSEPYVIVVPRDASRLHARLNAALAALREEGTLLLLEQRWFDR